MSKTIELTDDQYAILTEAAVARGKKVEALLAELIDEVRDPMTHPRYYETDDWLRHLGVSEERIQRINAEVEKEEAGEVRADADAR
jgi:hypothetical protein